VTTIGIPTTYKGVRFRSRLEARWGAFFDAIEWPWTYEPLDLLGYIPDFGILWEGRPPLLVEVKPALSLDELALAQRKVEASGWTRECLIVGAELFEPTSPTPIVGLICERVDKTFEFEWSPARLFECLSCGRRSVLSEDGSYRCRACGCDDGNAHLGRIVGGLQEAWSEAGNRVQWRAA
jgi:hypothetical protein